MKSAQVYLILIGMFLVSSCCKSYCTDEMLLVSFQKFKRQDVDTTYFIAYEKGSGFTKRTDSIPDIKAATPGDTLTSAEIKVLDISKDWEVKIPALNRTYYFNDYQLSTEKCNCGNNRFEKISSLKVNGVVVSNAFVILE